MDRRRPGGVSTVCDRKFVDRDDESDHRHAPTCLRVMHAPFSKLVALIERYTLYSTFPDAKKRNRGSKLTAVKIDRKRKGTEWLGCINERFRSIAIHN
jgi:hypothetical protein